MTTQMTKLNNRLFTIFLGLGILFFVVTIYMFITNEILPKTSSLTKHTLTINNVKFVKNDYADTSLISRQRQTSERMVYDENDKYPYCIKIINQLDSSVYAKSRVFNLKTIEPSETIEFYNSSIPQTTLNENYKISISLNDKSITDFNIVNFDSSLDLKNKKDNSTEKRELKLFSSDKKIIMFISISID